MFVINKKIAYLLLVHKNPEQVNIFLTQIQKIGNCDIYIHVDAKSKDIIPKINKSDNLHIYSEFDVKWGSFEIIEAAIYLMRRVKESKINYQHIYFGSGQDLLIKNGLLKYLDNNKESIFIKIEDKKILKNDRRGSRYKVVWPKKLMIRNDFHIYRFIRIGISILYKFGINLFPNKKQLSKEMFFYEGRTWFIIPFEVMNYFNDYLNDNEDYIEFWRDSLASDLMFFQTIIMNSPYKDKVKDELMFVEFGTKFKNMNHPLDLTMRDIDKLSYSNKYFARKFDEKIDKEVIEYYLNFIEN